MSNRRPGFKKFEQKLRPLTTDEIVQQLMEKGFYLGGSRSKLREALVKDSDWDFSYNIFGPTDVMPLLEELGFVEQDYSDYTFEDDISDNTLASMWKHPECKIEILGRCLFDSYKKVWDSIDPSFFCKYLWKSNPDRDPDKVEEHRKFIRDFINLTVDIADNVGDGYEPHYEPPSISPAPFMPSSTVEVEVEASYDLEDYS